MNTYYSNGAMYLKAIAADITAVPIELGNGTIYPGEFVNRLGEKRRTSFEMQDGWYLKYIGFINDVILFDTNTKSAESQESEWYYAFHYINKNLLFVTGGGIGHEIRINELNKLINVPINETQEQITLF